MCHVGLMGLDAPERNFRLYPLLAKQLAFFFICLQPVVDHILYKVVSSLQLFDF